MIFFVGSDGLFMVNKLLYDTFDIVGFPDPPTLEIQNGFHSFFVQAGQYTLKIHRQDDENVFGRMILA